MSTFTLTVEELKSQYVSSGWDLSYLKKCELIAEEIVSVYQKLQPIQIKICTGLPKRRTIEFTKKS